MNSKIEFRTPEKKHYLVLKANTCDDRRVLRNIRDSFQNANGNYYGFLCHGNKLVELIIPIVFE